MVRAYEIYTLCQRTFQSGIGEKGSVSQTVIEELLEFNKDILISILRLEFSQL